MTSRFRSEVTIFLSAFRVSVLISSCRSYYRFFKCIDQIDVDNITVSFIKRYLSYKE